MMLTGNLPPKTYSYSNILPRIYLSYSFEFQLVLFAFSLIMGDPFMVSSSLRKYGEGQFFPTNAFHGGRGRNFVRTIYRGIVLDGGANDQNIPRRMECIFQESEPF